MAIQGELGAAITKELIKNNYFVVGLDIKKKVNSKILLILNVIFQIDKQLKVFKKNLIKNKIIPTY